jgi:hypothetical protein
MDDFVADDTTGRYSSLILLNGIVVEYAYDGEPKAQTDGQQE